MSPLLLKELIIIFLFVVTAAGVVPCGFPKKRPRTSSIVQFIFYFWSFEISRNILRKTNIIGLDSYILNSFSYLSPIYINFSHCMTSSLKFKITVYFSGFVCQFIQGHFRGLIIRNSCLAYPLSFECLHCS